MKACEANLATTRRSGFRAITWLLLLAFTLQGFITQTHIHGAFGERIAATVTDSAAHKNAPAQNNTADCPFCQAIVHAGAFYAPGAQALPVPVFSVEMVALSFTTAIIAAVASHPWHSRAPPHA